MRSPLLVGAVGFLAVSCSPQPPCSPDWCAACCSPEGLCGACPPDSGATGGGAAGATGGSSGGSSGGEASGGGFGGSSGGGLGGSGGAGGGGGGGGSGGQSGGTAGGAAGGSGGGCTNGNSCMLGGNAGFGLCCGNVCRSLSDPLHCGSCGAQCASGTSCSQGRCTGSCDAGVCPAATACSTNSNSLQACFPTQCQGLPQHAWCSTAASSRAGRCCSSSCLDVSSDNNNCGYCGNRCSAGETCVNGSCFTNTNCATAPANSTCLIGTALGACCRGQCVALSPSTDRDNCGGCGLQCPAGDICTNATCRKPDAGPTNGCNSVPQACAPGTSCTSNAVRCAIDTCTGSTPGMPCVNPARPLPSGQVAMCCGNSCSDLSTDPANCGQCGRACGAGQFCEFGQCKPTPTCGLSNSGVNCPLAGGGVGQCCGGSCVNRQSSSSNCGACGASCPPGDVCTRGQCTLPDAGYAGGCANECPSGTVCNGNACLKPGCTAGASGEACGFGVGVGSNSFAQITGRCCNGSCVDLGQNAQNCNACGNSCSSALCVQAGPFGGFGGQCYAPASSNCQVGGCQGDTFCAGGRCIPRSCSAGFSGGTCQTASSESGMCCSLGLTSTCINPSKDPANCGGCGVSCGPGGTCNNGVCSTLAPPCGPGSLGQFCNLDAGTSNVCCPNGGCVDLKTNGTHCGRCGAACGNGLTCLNGACVALSCQGQTQPVTCANTDGGTLGQCCSGACVDRSRDPLNCGQCGRSCVGGESCTAGRCGLDTCTPSDQGLACHRDAGTGVGAGTCCTSSCLDTRNDRSNCGGCGRVCPGTTTCISGNCQ